MRERRGSRRCLYTKGKAESSWAIALGHGGEGEAESSWAVALGCGEEGVMGRCQADPKKPGHAVLDHGPGVRPRHGLLYQAGLA